MSAAPFICITVHDPATGNDVEHSLPAKFAVCGRCGGAGSHTNPSIDGNGLTAEDFEEQGDDFRADYMSGVYDVQCEECKGLRVVPEIDRDRCPKPLLKEYLRQQREESRYQAMCYAERRAEQGYCS